MPALASLALLALAQTNWKPYTLGGFAFQLPSPPESVPVPPQAAIDTKTWRSIHNGTNVIVVGVSMITDAKALQTPDGIIAAATAGALSAMKGTLLSQSDAVVGGWPALDFRLKSAAGFYGNSRVIIVGDKMVQLIAIGPTEAAAKAPFDRALAGFGLGKAAAGGQTVAGPPFAREKIGSSGASVEMPRPPEAQDIPVGTKPAGAVMHRFASNYGNRSYVAAYSDIPDPEAAKEEEIPKLLQFVNDDVIRALKATALPSSDTKLDGVYAIRTLAKLGTEGFVRVESTVQGGKLFTLISVVPAVWKDHAEQKWFFDSFRFAAPAGG